MIDSTKKFRYLFSSIKVTNAKGNHDPVKLFQPMLHALFELSKKYLMMGDCLLPATEKYVRTAPRF